MEGFVYEWINNLNGKWYIGSHNGKKSHYISGGTAILKAIKKYGIENFTRHKFYCDDFLEQEDAALKNRDARNDPMSYNMRSSAIGGYERLGGKDSPMFGRKHTDETKHKMSIAKRGKVRSEEHKRNLSKGSVNNVKAMNTSTGEVYTSITQAALDYGINKYTLSGWLSTPSKMKHNKTNLIVVSNIE